MTTGSGKSVEVLEAEATAWAVKLDAAPDETPPGLQEWCASDARHAGALLRAQATLALFEPVAEPEHIQEPAEEPMDVPARFSLRKRLALAGGTLAALAACAVAVVTLHVPDEKYETQIGELRSVALSDGSSVSIDAKSRIDVAFDAGHRDVHLLAGKALFHATHNAARPFRVIVGNVTVTDLGTVFEVSDDASDGMVDVLVTQGSVRVDSPMGQLTLVTGQRARFAKVAGHGPAPRPVPVASAEIDRMLAWRDGRLELDGETLDSAVADINRHSRLQVHVASPALGRQSLYGSFRMDDAEGFASAAAMSLGAQAHKGPDGIVIAP
ncbi:FecR family protein [Novosphingobium sp. 9]|uniref:FecR family protein n=1 Tax=Novosphingobium sp. 9 TaxID=2025349 RepID=UPI0021B6D7CE|nr:FecR domain-containing protein [Novosphingobium sp. 9]